MAYLSFIKKFYAAFKFESLKISFVFKVIINIFSQFLDIVFINGLVYAIFNVKTVVKIKIVKIISKRA
jgi:hypothetical protein